MKPKDFQLLDNEPIDKAVIKRDFFKYISPTRSTVKRL